MLADETIDRVRREARIVEVVGERVALTRRGRSFVGLCPFHKEKTPSFHVNEERGFYHCFGCQASGDSIRFLRELDGLSFIDAIRVLAERQGIPIVETGSDDERREQAEARRRREELFSVGELAARYWERQLVAHPLAHLARAEIARRGLGEPGADDAAGQTLRAFRIGYAPEGWDSLARHLREIGAPLGAAETVGLVAPRKSGPGHYDRFRHRLVFAILDLEGKIVGFSGRTLADPTAEELRALGLRPREADADPPPKYLNSPESPIFRKRDTVFGLHQARQAIRSEDRAILVEGNFDVVSLHARGISNAVAPLGTAFTPEQARQLRRFSHRVTLLFDGDAAGRRAVLAAKAPCAEVGLAASVASLPEGRDPDDLARQGGAEALHRLIRAARSLLEHLIDSTLDAGFGEADAQGRAAAIRSVAAIIQAEEDPAVRALAERHADRVAERLGIADARTFRALAGVIQRAATSGPAAAAPLAEPPERARSRARRHEIALELLGALLDCPELLDTPEVEGALSSIEGAGALAIAALRHNPSLVRTPELLLAKLPASIHPFAAARLAAPRHETPDDAKAELLGNVDKLKRLELSRQKIEAIDELSRVQTTGDFDREMALLAEQARRARARHGL